MATTSKGIVYPVVGDALTPLANHFANLATSTDTAITNAQSGFMGTDAARLALTSPALRAGITWFATDTGLMWQYNGTAWAPAVPHALVKNRRMSATNTFTNQTTYADFPVSADKTALDGTFVKTFADTRLVLNVSGTAELNSGTQQSGQLALNIGGTNYAVASYIFPLAVSRGTITGVLEVTGLAAGSYAVKPRFQSSTASVFRFDTGDIVSYSVTEVW